LLAHPAVDVNYLDVYGATPFQTASMFGQALCARLLLNDARVDLNNVEENEGTALWTAAFEGHVGVIQEWIASGRAMNLGPLGNPKGIIETAREKNRHEVVLLLERFVADPVQTRHEVRVELGMLDEQAAAVFASIVFLCEGLLQLKPALHDTITASAAAATTAAATRFFTIAKRLPMELQMILSRRAVGSMKQNILHQDSETAFKSLARVLLPPSK